MWGNVLQIVAKSQTSTAETPVQILVKDSYLNGILMLGACVGEKLPLDSILSYGYCKSVKMAVMATNKANCKVVTRLASYATLLY